MKEEKKGNLEEQAKKMAEVIRAELKLDELKSLKDEVGKFVDDKLKSDTALKIFVSEDVQKEVGELTKEEACDAYAKAILMQDHTVLKALSEGTAADGGYTVHDEFYNKLMSEIYEMTDMRPLVTVVPMKARVLKLDIIDKGPKVYWTSELQDKTTTTAEFSQPTLTAYKMAAIIYLSDELIEDSAYSLTDVIVSRFAEEMAQEEDAVILQGSGVGRPTGIFSAGTITTVACAGNLDFDDIINVEYALPKRYRANARWLVHPNNVKELRKLQDSDGRYLWQDPVASDQPSMIHGYPVVENYNVPEDEIGFGDWKTCYWLGDRQKMTVKFSNDTTTAFTTDATAIRVVARIAGTVVFPNAARILNTIP